MSERKRLVRVKLAQKQDKLPIGILYHDQESKPYHAHLDQLKGKALIKHWNNGDRNIGDLVEEMR